MLRNSPILKYSGLTVILSNPSRFDTTKLLTANAGVMFNDYCLQPEFNPLQCDIRLMDDKSPFIKDTKCLLLLGEATMHKYCPQTQNNTLNEIRGSVLDVNGIPAIASYFPQDAVDIKDYESTNNPLSQNYSTDEEYASDDDDEEEGDDKNLSPTKRSNYAFWLRRDAWKAKYIIRQGIPKRPEAVYKIYPSSQEVIDILTKNKNKHLYFDIETDYEEQNLLCFSFSFSDSDYVYSVPVLNNEYRWAYSALHHILKALAIAFRDNIVVAHNGHTFDFPVMSRKYKININRAYDTLIAMHRCFPDIEKSLGHCTSYWTWESFHKDMGQGGYFTRDDMMRMLQYCGKDVFTMKLIHRGITEYASKIPGLEASIKCGMDSIKPYVTCSLQGIRYNPKKMAEIKKEDDRLMTQYIRIINLLIGESGMAEVRKAIKGKKAGAFPGSNAQCCKYFHDILGYSHIGKPSAKTGKTSLGKQNMYKLALKYPDNPVITFTLLYRQMQKEYGTLKFIPWKDDKNKIINPRTYNSEAQLGYGLLPNIPTNS